MEEQGYALLIAASPAARHPVLDAGEALPALAAATPSALLGTRTGNVVQLAEPGDPHTVLSQLRTAAAHDGPLLVYVAGQLGLDPRQRLPHLALSRSTPRSVRYTGLPWHWLAAELACRPGGEGRTAVVADLVADPALWEHRGEHRVAAGLTLYGTLAPPPAKRRTAALDYSRALAAALRTVTVRPPLDELHRHCARRGRLTAGTELFGGAPDGDAPAPLPPAGGFDGASAAVIPGHGQDHGQGHGQGNGWAPYPDRRTSTGGWGRPPASAAVPQQDEDPHTAIYQAVHEGRHGEAATIAAEWETAALRATGPASREAVHWIEVRADLAHQADDPERSCTLWLHAAGARLQAGQSPYDPEVFGAVDRAHHCWHKVADVESARELGLQLVELRQRAPGRQPGALEDVRARLATLANGAAQHTG